MSSSVRGFSRIGMGFRIGERFSLVLAADSEGRGGVWRLRPPPSAGGVGGCTALVDPLLEPVQNFLLDPPDPALPELHPLGELPGSLETGDMLRAVEDQLLKL